MKAVFVELPAFERYRSDYLDDDGFLALQNLLMKRPEAGDLIQDTGGCASFGSPMCGAVKANGVGCG